MVEYIALALKQTSREATIPLYAPALDPHLQNMAELADQVFCIYHQQAPANGRKAEARCQEPRERLMHTHEVALEVETAKEILAEVFHARPGEVEEMIKSRLVERCWPEERRPGRKSTRKGGGRRLFARGVAMGRGSRSAGEAQKGLGLF